VSAAPGVVVVTGASAGVGRATAVEFGRQGRSVALLVGTHGDFDDTSKAHSPQAWAARQLGVESAALGVAAAGAVAAFTRRTR
jgi:NAD(P)-dependent dehydrogenase (short-subunit alcohol dehydrogenase family)